VPRLDTDVGPWGVVLLLTFDLVGTFVFAISGAAAGVKNRMCLA
jgi:uncharacterized membrane protein YeiH